MAHTKLVPSIDADGNRNTFDIRINNSTSEASYPFKSTISTMSKTENDGTLGNNADLQPLTKYMRVFANFEEMSTPQVNHKRGK